MYNHYLLDMVSDDMDYDTFNECVIKAGELTATIVKKKCEGWFQFSRESMAPLLEERNAALHNLRQVESSAPSLIIDELKRELKVMKKKVADAVCIAKARWYTELCQKIHDMDMNPRLAWEYIRILTKGEAAHHRKSKNMAMRMEDGKKAGNDKENMEVMYPHFQRVFNNHRPVDDSVLDLLEQRRTEWDLNDCITWKEFDRAVNKLTAGKAPGLNGIPPEAYKAMDANCRRKVFRHVQDFWEGKVDHESWHRSQCVPVPKQGDLSNPNKWRGVMLMDVCSKIFSIIMNERAFKILDKHGTKFQFGGTPKLGCRDGLFTIKTLLNMRKNHNLESYVGFVDLVKAYDTANHELLLKILEKYGAPPNFVAAIERMYQDLSVVLKIGKSVEEIVQEVGVRQGDNMAPVLFLFLMTAFAETLEIVWKEKGIEIVTIQGVTEQDFEAGNGCVKSHLIPQYTSRSLTALEIFQCLYVDDGAFVFATRGEMAKGLNLVYEHFARLGLEMHIGRDGTASKTECVFFPSPNFFRNIVPSNALAEEAEESAVHDDCVEGMLTDAERRQYESEKSRIAREDVAYDELAETQSIPVMDGYVTFTRHFKYLGSYISYNLRDDFDVEARLTSASQSFGALKNCWDNPHMDIYNKYMLFRAIPMNLLLWGCETWSLRQVLLNKLEVFLHQSIRRILGINMTQVQEDRIRNDHVRQMFYDIPRVRNMIAARQMDFIGKVSRGDWSQPAKRMITACCANKRLAQRPNFHNKDALVKNLKLLFAPVSDVVIDDRGSLKDWINEVSDETYWTKLVRCLLDRDADLPKRPAHWTHRRRSPRNHDRDREEQPFPPTPPRPRRNERNNSQNADPPSPPRRRVPPPRRESTNANAERDYIAENVGFSLYDSLKVLGLGLGASETEVKVSYRAMSRRFHPDKHDSSETGMSDAEATEFFQLINNANSFLREVM